LVELLHAKEQLWARSVSIGNPVIALLLSVLFATRAFGRRCGRGAGELLKFSEQSVSGIGMTLILVGAGGGFALVMRTAGVDKQLAELAAAAGLPSLVYGWLVLGLHPRRHRLGDRRHHRRLGLHRARASPRIRAPVPSVMVISIGCGSLFLSHLNDSGFWMVKECLGLSVGQTLRTWTITETLIGFSGLGMALLAEQVMKFLN
jgi:GntP family gluconate:H+ symporter